MRRNDARAPHGGLAEARVASGGDGQPPCSLKRGSGVVGGQPHGDRHSAFERHDRRIADPRRERWFGQVEGDLRPGGEFRLSVEASGVESRGRVEACEPPRRLAVTTRETDESWRQGQGAPPFDEAIQATLTADGSQTILVIEVQGMPLDKVAFYGAGWQMHAEDLAAYLAGRERLTEARFDELVPPYQDLAANIG